MNHKGSITIFGILALVLVMECLLVLCEGARFITIKKSSALQSEIAMDAVRASYHKVLWDEYHLMASEQAQIEETLRKYGDARTSFWEWRENLLEYKLEDVEVLSYTLLTDGDGEAFVMAVSDYMEDHVLYESAKAIYGWYESIKTIRNTYEPEVEKAEEVLEKLETSKDVKVSRASSSSKADGEADTDTEPINPLEFIKDLEKMGVLQLVLENPSEVSQKEVDLSQSVSNRELPQGKEMQMDEHKWWDRILLQQYLISYLSCYGNEKDRHALSYELEYLLVGEDSDIENLKGVVEELLLIRQTVNMLYLFNDEVKGKEAEAIGIALSTALGIPEFYEAVGVAVLVAWAYGEAILDVRGLLQGKRIPLLKSTETWTLQLSGMEELMEGSISAKDSEAGLSYMDYLGILLLMKLDSDLSMRAMDVQEQTIRRICENESFCMEHLSIRAEAVMKYRYRPIFGIFDRITEPLDWNYEIERKVHTDVSL